MITKSQRVEGMEWEFMFPDLKISSPEIANIKIPWLYNFRQIK